MGGTWTLLTVLALVVQLKCLASVLPANDVLGMYLKDQWNEDEVAGGSRSNKEIMKMTNADKIGNNHREISSAPHVAGSPRNNELAAMLKKYFEDMGFDSVQMPKRSYLLSKPDPQNPNLIRIYSASNETIFTSHYMEESPLPEDKHPNFLHAFNAYTPKGDVWSAPGEVAVYANYGKVSDFEFLEKSGISVKNKIVIIRYGSIFRGNKILNAATFGAVGVILFSDPDDVAWNGQKPEDVYPNTDQLPDTGIQRGTAFLKEGDPLTPGWPSIDEAYRISPDRAGLPTIPCQPIGYSDAKQILSMLGGTVAPAKWQGKIGGIEYRIGPEVLPEYSNCRLRLTTHNEQMQTDTYNVIATITGEVEPDRYVILGNHRDAWGFGAVDPGSGTAQLMETARVLGELKKQGWKPRRSIVLCSWDAEEYGMIGSTEWVEENIFKLQSRAIAYINTDICSEGSYISLSSSPLLWELLTKVTSMVPGIRNPDHTLFDEWIEYDKMLNSNAPEHPTLSVMGSGSDFVSFMFYAGVPAFSIGFRRDRSKKPVSYPGYHTGFDTRFLLANLTDPGFKITQGCSRLATTSVKYLSDSLVLPFSVSRYARALKDGLRSFESSGKKAQLKELYDKYDYLELAVDQLMNDTQQFQDNIKTKTSNVAAIRTINDQLMMFERNFIMPSGIPGRQQIRHAAFAPSRDNIYASGRFPGINDLLTDCLAAKDEQQMSAIREDLRRHISDLTILVKRACSWLKDAQDLV